MVCWGSVAFLHGIERGQGGCRRHVRWYLTCREAWRQWRRDAKGRGQRIQNARGKSDTTVSAIVVDFLEPLIAIGAVNVYGHTHF
jgi:hypothetical protein